MDLSGSLPFHLLHQLLGCESGLVALTRLCLDWRACVPRLLKFHTQTLMVSKDHQELRVHEFYLFYQFCRAWRRFEFNCLDQAFLKPTP